MLKYDYKLQVVHQVAVNSAYICYGLKAGPVRVLNKNTAGRTLFKDHSSMLADMRFFNWGSNLLASCDMDGDVVVRKVRLEWLHTSSHSFRPFGLFRGSGFSGWHWEGCLA